ncbi:MAG: hypothetical protein ACU0BK_18335 [Shimia sp.]|uniref:hypothetical protein n=1 Tax=Shimia sp. TaxID=1954381 RepID=UPI00405A0ADC
MSLKRLSTLLLIAALAVPVLPKASLAQSQRLIPLVDGRTCWAEGSRRCFRFSTRSRRAHRAGFGAVYVPPESETQPGFITESTFIQIERAISKQVGSDR